MCEQEDRIGTYLFEYDTLEGDCGDLDSSINRTDAPPAEGIECAEDADDRWTDGDCKLERAYTCVFPQGQSASYVAITTQRDSDGDKITGKVTVTFFDASGALGCRGTYGVTMTRQ